jgi:hypothetical protein
MGGGRRGTRTHVLLRTYWGGRRRHSTTTELGLGNDKRRQRNREIGKPLSCGGGGGGGYVKARTHQCTAHHCTALVQTYPYGWPLRHFSSKKVEKTERQTKQTIDIGATASIGRLSCIIMGGDDTDRSSGQQKNTKRNEHTRRIVSGQVTSRHITRGDGHTFTHPHARVCAGSHGRARVKPRHRRGAVRRAVRHKEGVAHWLRG